MPTLAPLAPRTVVALRYRVLSLLGRGGMGHVYRAEHLGLKKQIALKILDAALEGDLEARFEREARATARLDHPSCVRILDYGRTTDGRQYIATELVDGPTLAQVLGAEGRLSTGRAVRIARNLLAGLAHAHAAGILHRDVKPENVMLSERGGVPRTVLIDFGLARLRDEAALTAAGLCVGSPSYLAPERLLGRLYDARADLYAVGVILYEMLAGVRPIVGATVQDILRAHIDRPPRPLRSLRADISPALEGVVVRALAKDPARRFPDAEAMLAALVDVPVLEQLAAATAIATREEEVTTTAVAELAPDRPSLTRRLVTWLRFGRWRWDPHPDRSRIAPRGA